MRIGLIDLGTNSLRFSFWDISSRPKGAHLLHRKKTMILPGEEVFKSGRIPPKSVKRMLKSLRQFEDKAQILEAEAVVAVATCAMREAKNSKSVLKEIQSKTSIPLQVISGPREAELIAQGVLRSEPRLRGTHVLIDIGGGSTEVSLIKDRKIVKSTSLALGAQRLYQLFPDLMAGGPTEIRWECSTEIRQYVQKELTKRLKSWPKPQARSALGSSGTIRTLGKLIARRRAAGQSRLAWTRQINSRRKLLPKYTYQELIKLNHGLLFLTEKQLTALAGVEPERRKLLVHGSLLLEEILNYFELEKVACTEGSLRDGVIEEIEQGVLKPRPLTLKPPLPDRRRKKRLKKKKKKLKKILSRYRKATRKKVLSSG